MQIVNAYNSKHQQISVVNGIGGISIIIYLNTVNLIKLYSPYLDNIIIWLTGLHKLEGFYLLIGLILSWIFSLILSPFRQSNLYFIYHAVLDCILGFINMHTHHVTHEHNIL